MFSNGELQKQDPSKAGKYQDLENEGGADADGTTRETGKKAPELKIDENKRGGIIGLLPEEPSKLKALVTLLILIFMIVHLFFDIL